MIPFPNKKYNIIYADPAWHYDKRNEGNRNVQNKYSTLSFEDIYNLPVKEISAPDLDFSPALVGT